MSLDLRPGFYIITIESGVLTGDINAIIENYKPVIEAKKILDEHTNKENFTYENYLKQGKTSYKQTYFIDSQYKALLDRYTSALAGIRKNNEDIITYMLNFVIGKQFFAYYNSQWQIFGWFDIIIDNPTITETINILEQPIEYQYVFNYEKLDNNLLKLDTYQLTKILTEFYNINYAITFDRNKKYIDVDTYIQTFINSIRPATNLATNAATADTLINTINCIIKTVNKNNKNIISARPVYSRTQKTTTITPNELIELAQDKLYKIKFDPEFFSYDLLVYILYNDKNRIIIYIPALQTYYDSTLDILKDFIYKVSEIVEFNINNINQIIKKEIKMYKNIDNVELEGDINIYNMYSYYLKNNIYNDTTFSKIYGSEKIDNIKNIINVTNTTIETTIKNYNEQVYGFLKLISARIDSVHDFIRTKNKTTKFVRENTPESDTDEDGQPINSTIEGIIYRALDCIPYLNRNNLQLKLKNLIHLKKHIIQNNQTLDESTKLAELKELENSNNLQFLLDGKNITTIPINTEVTGEKCDTIKKNSFEQNARKYLTKLYNILLINQPKLFDFTNTYLTDISEEKIREKFPDKNIHFLIDTIQPPFSMQNGCLRWNDKHIKTLDETLDETPDPQEIKHIKSVINNWDSASGNSIPNIGHENFPPNNTKLKNEINYICFGISDIFIEHINTEDDSLIETKLKLKFNKNDTNFTEFIKNDSGDSTNIKVDINSLKTCMIQALPSGFTCVSKEELSPNITNFDRTVCLDMKRSGDGFLRIYTDYLNQLNQSNNIYVLITHDLWNFVQCCLLHVPAIYLGGNTNYIYNPSDSETTYDIELNNILINNSILDIPFTEKRGIKRQRSPSLSPEPVTRMQVDQLTAPEPVSASSVQEVVAPTASPDVKRKKTNNQSPPLRQSLRSRGPPTDWFIVIKNTKNTKKGGNNQYVMNLKRLTELKKKIDTQISDLSHLSHLSQEIKIYMQKLLYKNILYAAYIEILINDIERYNKSDSIITTYTSDLKRINLQEIITNISQEIDLTKLNKSIFDDFSDYPFFHYNKLITKHYFNPVTIENFKEITSQFLYKYDGYNITYDILNDYLQDNTNEYINHIKTLPLSDKIIKITEILNNSIPNILLSDFVYNQNDQSQLNDENRIISIYTYMDYVFESTYDAELILYSELFNEIADKIAEIDDEKLIKNMSQASKLDKLGTSSTADNVLVEMKPNLQPVRGFQAPAAVGTLGTSIGSKAKKAGSLMPRTLLDYHKKYYYTYAKLYYQ